MSVEMHDLTDDERRDVLGELLLDEFKVIRKRLDDLPAIAQELHLVHGVVDDISDKILVIEAVVREHEKDLRKLKRRAA